MTPAEEQCIKEAKALLLLHFDAFVLTTRVADENRNDRINSDWHGSLAEAMGLTRITQVRMDAIALDRSELPPS